MILASQSPRRKAILASLGYAFHIVASSKDEVFDLSLPIDDALKKVAASKALDVQSKYPEELIIGADTICVLDGRILGKPKSRQDAIDTLCALSGRSHEIKTAFCVLKKAQMICEVQTTMVYFRKLEMAEILAYVDSGRCMDKAASYGIQECDFVDHIEGSYENVVGLDGASLDLAIRHIL